MQKSTINYMGQSLRIFILVPPATRQTKRTTPFLIKSPFSPQSDTMRVIWAYSYDDPVTEYAMTKHDHRGTKSIFLQEPQFTLPTFGEDVFDWEVRMNNVGVLGLGGSFVLVVYGDFFWKAFLVLLLFCFDCSLYRILQCISPYFLFFCGSIYCC